MIGKYLNSCSLLEKTFDEAAAIPVGSIPMGFLQTTAGLVQITAGSVLFSAGEITKNINQAHPEKGARLTALGKNQMLAGTLNFVYGGFTFELGHLTGGLARRYLNKKHDNPMGNEAAPTVVARSCFKL